MISKSTDLDVRSFTRGRGLAGRLGAAFALATALVAAVVVAVPGGPASAAPSLRVSPPSGLDPAGQIVVVSGSGYNPNAQLFVMECRASSAEDHTCNSVGLQKVTTNAAGAFSTRLRVVGNFGATDCLRIPCGVKTSAVSGHVDDRSQDRSAGLSFRAPAPPVTQPPATQPPATQPPATLPPATRPPATTAPGAGPTTTTVAGGTSSTTAAGGAATTTSAAGPAGGGATSTTEAGSGDGSSATGGSGSGDEAASGPDAAPVSSSRSDDDGSGSAPLVIAIVVVLAVAGAGTTVFLRRRSAT